jgi:hypothetical protein
MRVSSSARDVVVKRKYPSPQLWFCLDPDWQESPERFVNAENQRSPNRLKKSGGWKTEARLWSRFGFFNSFSENSKALNISVNYPGQTDWWRSGRQQ